MGQTYIGRENNGRRREVELRHVERLVEKVRRVELVQSYSLRDLAHGLLPGADLHLRHAGGDPGDTSRGSSTGDGAGSGIVRIRRLVAPGARSHRLLHPVGLLSRVSRNGGLGLRLRVAPVGRGLGLGHPILSCGGSSRRGRGCSGGSDVDAGSEVEGLGGVSPLLLLVVTLGRVRRRGGRGHLGLLGLAVGLLGVLAVAIARRRRRHDSVGGAERTGGRLFAIKGGRGRAARSLSLGESRAKL